MRQFLCPLLIFLLVICVGINAFTQQGLKSLASIEKAPFGATPQGQTIDIYTLKNINGMTMKVMTYGAIITELYAPDKANRMADIVLGFDNLKSYFTPPPYFGAIVGRVANRIKAGEFTLDGVKYTLAKNNGLNALHGGVLGFDKQIWTAEPIPTYSEGPAIVMSMTSPDGQEGYPGNLTTKVTYILTNNNELKIIYNATTDKATPINLSQHSYFNLAGQGSGSIRNHRIMIDADGFTPVDDNLIPTGKISPVAGTAFDFRKSTRIGARLKDAGGDPVGYDLNYVLNGKAGKVRCIAKVSERKSGRVMEVWTDQPGVQFYTGNFLDGTLAGKGGAVYEQYSGFCLETQHYPDSINNPQWPSIVLRPGQHYKQTCIYKFMTEK